MPVAPRLRLALRRCPPQSHLKRLACATLPLPLRPLLLLWLQRLAEVLLLVLLRHMAPRHMLARWRLHPVPPLAASPSVQLQRSHRGYRSAPLLEPAEQP